MIPRKNQRPNVIDVNCPEGVRGEGDLKAGVTTLLPGMLIDIDTTTDNRPRELPVVKPHATAGGDCVLRIALNDIMHGQNVDELFGLSAVEDSLDDDQFDHVPFIVPRKGEAFMACVADEFTGSNGDLLKSGGNGYFVQHAGSGKALAQIDDEAGVDYTLDPPPADRVLLVRAVAL